jgi:ATP-binding cassette subfamily B protein
MNGLFRIIQFSWSLKRYYIATMVIAVIIAALNQVTPFIVKVIVDGIVDHNAGKPADQNLVILLVFLILVVNLAIAVISNYGGYLGDILGVKLNRLLSQRYYDHLLKLPLSYFDEMQAGKITSRLDRSIVTISTLVQSFANTFVGFFLTSIFTIAVMAFFAWPVAVMLALLFPIYIWLTTLSSRDWQKRQEPINEKTDITKARFVEAIGQIRVVKSFVQERREFGFMSRNFKGIYSDTKVQSINWHWYDVVRRSFLGIIFTGIYGYIIWQAWNGDITLGTLTLLLQLAIQAQFPLFAISFIVDNLQRAEAGSRDYFEAMEIVPDIADAQGAVDLVLKEGRIEFKDVTFSYNDSKTVLNDFSFTISPTNKIALVGESGEGKTTITNLLLRFYEPKNGSITIDGQNIAAVTQTSLRQNVGVVFQEPALFSGTIKENITYAKPSASDKEIQKAIVAANAANFIDKLPDGLETQIGERGVKLSGGQKQRIAIARAILKDAPILILDEATSSLDSKAEREVQDALETLMRGRTTIIIAHRLSTIASVDEIIGIKGGRIVEQGSPAKLAKANGIYAELLSLQQPSEKNIAKLKTYDISAN